MADLKKFQRKCLENERYRRELAYEDMLFKDIEAREKEKILSEWNIMREAQERLGKDYEPIEKWGGLKKNKCPCCGDELRATVVFVSRLYDYQILYCLTCGYRFARLKRNNND